MKTVSLVLFCLALLGGRGELNAQAQYKEISVTNGGTIRGAVRLSGPVPKQTQMVIAKDEKICGSKKPSPRLSLGKAGGLRNSIVWLEGIVEGKKRSSFARQLVLDQLKCEYRPHILLLPQGSSLDIVNSDPILHNVHTYEGGDNGKTLFNIAQPVKGQRTTVKQTQFKKPGLYLATCDAGHPWMNAYIMVTAHPYFALTDDRGEFVLNDVPPGTYTVKMWHEGVNIIRTEMENGKPKAYRFEDPYKEVKEVFVSPGKKVSVDFSVTLRTEPTVATAGSSSLDR